jgi:hypothetical protein
LEQDIGDARPLSLDRVAASAAPVVACDFVVATVNGNYVRAFFPALLFVLTARFFWRYARDLPHPG